MAISIDDLENAEEAAEMAESARATRRQRREEREQYREVRETLEDPARPMPDGGGGDVGVDEELCFAMTEERRIGSQVIEVDGETVRFGKPSGFASADLDGQLDDLQSSEASTREVLEWCTNTLEAWCLDEGYDAEFWGHNFAMMDLIVTVRRMTLGGNGPGTS